MVSATGSRGSFSSFNNHRDWQEEESYSDESKLDVPLMKPGRFDDLPSPMKTEPKGNKVCRLFLNSWSQRAIATAAVAGSVGLRVMNFYLSTNAIGCYMAGFAVLHTILYAAPPQLSARIRWIALPIFGQTSLYAFSQAWANDSKRKDKTVFDDVIIGSLGVNLYMMLKWAWDQRGIRSVSYVPEDVPQSADRLSAPLQHYKKYCCKNWSSQDWIHLAKFLASVGFGAGALAARDHPVWQGILSYLSTFFVSQIAGERVIEKVDKEIKAKEMKGEETDCSSFKTALLTVAYIAQVASFTPWYVPTSSQRLAQLVYVGISLGFFDGINDRSENLKVENTPIEHLNELKKLSVPERGGCCTCRGECCTCTGCKWLAHRVWKLSVPLISIAAMIGFVTWQDVKKLDAIDAKIILGGTLAGFGIGTSFCYSVDEMWDPEKRRPWIDFFMKKIWFSPRILGIDPLFLYFVITNAVKIDSEAIDENTDPSHLALFFMGWFIYGGRMGHELFIGASDRIGNPQRKYPKMAVINAMAAFILYLYGDN